MNLQPWHEAYPKGVSPTIHPEDYTSVVDVFERAVLMHGDRPAFSNMGVTLTFRQVDDLSKAFASYLQQELHLTKGDKIVLQMPNLLQYPVALYGALRAGLVIVNTNPLYTPREMQHQFRDSGAKAIVIVANFAHHLEKILGQTHIKHVIVTDIGDLMPIPKRWLVNFVIRKIKKMVPPYELPNAISFNEVLKVGHHLKFNPVTLTPESVAFLQYTGGTTGIAKGAILSHRNIVANMLQISEWMKPKIVDAEVVMAPLPLYHIFSLTVNCLAFFKQGGHNILITNPRDIPALIQELKKTKFTVFVGLNTLFNALLNHPDFQTVNFTHLKISVAGGMAMQKTVVMRWQEVTGTPLVEGYGLTEASPVVCCNPIDGSDRIGTIGLPLPSTEVRLVCDDGRIASHGEEGELQCRGPQVMQGYWQRLDETKLVMTEDGWLKTGDMARMQEDGFFQVVDRKKDMILVSGFNVYPNEVEEVVAACPGILEVAVVGIPDKHSGEAVKAFVVRKNEQISEEQIIEHCRQNLAGYKVPKLVEFRSELPKTNVGKVLRRALKTDINTAAQ